MRVNPLNDIVDRELDLLDTGRFSMSFNSIPEDDMDEMEDEDLDQDEIDDPNDNIFLFLD